MLGGNPDHAGAEAPCRPRELRPEDAELAHRQGEAFPLLPVLGELLFAAVGEAVVLAGAASEPTLGFIYGPNGSACDPALGWGHPMDADLSLFPPCTGDSLIGIEFARILWTDARLDIGSGHSPNVFADLEAIGKIVGQWQTPFLEDRVAALRIAEIWLSGIQKVIAQSPGTFSDEELIRTAHQVSQLNRQEFFLHLTGDRARFQDFLQRAYTPDAEGNGRLTPEGVKLLQRLAPQVGQSASVFMALQAGLSLSSPRRLLKEYDRIMNKQFEELQKPLRQVNAVDATQWEIGKINASIPLQIEEYPLLIFVPNTETLTMIAERVMVLRDAALCGLALEAYRRKYGIYPTTLEALTPTFLPSIPADPVTGNPVRYVLKKGGPRVYSVGADRKDDGGIPPTLDGRPANGVQEMWRYVSPENAMRGDWILYPPTD